MNLWFGCQNVWAEAELVTTTSFQLFHGGLSGKCEHSRAWSTGKLPIHKLQKIKSKTTSPAKSFGKVEPNLASTPSLECLRRKLLEESLIWLSTWTILSRSRAGAKVYFSNIVLKNFNHAGFSTDKMASTKNPVKNNFSSLPLLRPKIVEVSLVDGLLGCS